MHFRLRSVQEVILHDVLTTELSRQIFNVILAVGLAFTFPTIRRFFERITDRVFYRDRYDPQLLVSDIGRVLASEILLEQLAKKVLALIGGQMRIEGSNIVVMSKEKIFYQTHARQGEVAYEAAELARFQRGVTITDELANGEKREILERHNVRVILPLRTKESFIGYLLLGEKKSGDIFSTQDIQTLEIIADELAVAILNARSYQEIQLFNETLREKVRVATAELRNANEELKDLDKAKDEFISMASHQLRTPLTAVRGYTSMVMDGDFGRITGEQKETLKQSFDAATRMTRLVDDLLNVSRMQSGKFKIERGDVDLNKVIPEEVSLLDTTAQMKHVTITFHAPKKHVPVLSIDEGKTRQCLMNLMDNAVYYSSTGKSPGKVDVYLEADSDWVSFRVVDNGIGVPKAQQNKLFQKFYRAPNAQKTRPDGTGLGLFLVGRVVKDQAGEIIFESEEGKGSTFGFRLPVKAAGEGI
jgi:signal transduction histidine kinase